MKYKIIIIALTAIIFFSCKNEETLENENFKKSGYITADVNINKGDIFKSKYNLEYSKKNDTTSGYYKLYNSQTQQFLIEFERHDPETGSKMKISIYTAPPPPFIPNHSGGADVIYNKITNGEIKTFTGSSSVTLTYVARYTSLYMLISGKVSDIQFDQTKKTVKGKYHFYAQDCFYRNGFKYDTIGTITGAFSVSGLKEKE